MTRHDDLSISLRMELRPHQRDVPPGWYLDVRRNEGYDALIDRVRVTPARARVIADVLGPAVQRAVEDANRAALKEVNRRYDIARDAAARAEVLAADAATLRAELSLARGEDDR